MSFKKSAVIGATLLASIFASSAVHAATTTSKFDVTLTVLPKCVITNSSIADINLGTVDTGATNLIGNTTFTMQCTKKTAYSISLTPGAVGAGANNTGTLKGAADATQTVAYGLFSDAAAVVPWGKTSFVTGTSSATSSAGVDFKVYAKVASVPDVPQDKYTDNVTITVTY
ncbi:Csu type fimbrial protein [Diaphorobacter aerolatus]|uniref:Spore coat protein U domain-containing protein n=1 Tax=Diaphorobacter aerolatus TaxID=1288495 RepID=A0A7H0GP43_9BURK|nr:spore coat protein U domain-containing protein [Diaphorobacter aerolatus]QNP50059.1 spore coat protein U domain-containing protein [Diaphorobacter aerolatus]